MGVGIKMNFEQQINEFEKNNKLQHYLIKEGKIPVMLTAVHTIRQEKSEYVKPSEPYTSAICQYVGNEIDGSYFIKAIDTGIDTNSIIIDEFKQRLLKMILDNNIKLLIDLHGASETRDFDVEIGTLNNLSADHSTIKTLIDCFKNNGINQVAINNPFIGGGVTRYIYENTDIDVIQLEINHRYRDINNLGECQKVCDALTEFIIKYNMSR